MSNYSDPNYVSYIRQRANARRRNIKWELSFEEWLSIWKESGQLENRGVGKSKFCMARYDDYGPYSKDNVEIVPFGENSRQWLLSKANNNTMLKMEDWDINAWRKRNSPFDVLDQISKSFYK